jgi:hypothetical protein
MMSIIVVLPAPLGPMMQRSSPGAMSSESLLIARKPSKAHAHVFQVQDAAVGGVDLARTTGRPKPAARPPDAVRWRDAALRIRRDPARAFFHQVRRHGAFLHFLTRPTTPFGQEQRDGDEQRAQEVQPELGRGRRSASSWRR